jgi:hypothetical protein
MWLENNGRRLVCSMFVLARDDNPIQYSLAASIHHTNTAAYGTFSQNKYSHFQPRKTRFHLPIHVSLPGPQTHQSPAFLPHHHLPFPKLPLPAENLLPTHPSPRIPYRPTNSSSTALKNRSPLCLAYTCTHPSMHSSPKAAVYPPFNPNMRTMLVSGPGYRSPGVLTNQPLLHSHSPLVNAVTGYCVHNLASFPKHPPCAPCYRSTTTPCLCNRRSVIRSRYPTGIIERAKALWRVYVRTW